MDEKSPFSKLPPGSSASDARNQLVKDMVEKERAATDAKTAKLRALRLAKEAADRAAAPPPAPAKKKKPAR
jgi:hypothetical protein